MLCPNCKTELVQIKGRYICSDCGLEIPESEVNVGDWGQGSFDGNVVIPAPGVTNVSSDSTVNGGGKKVLKPTGKTVEGAVIDGEVALQSVLADSKLKPSGPPKLEIKQKSKFVDLESLMKNLEGIGSTKMAQNLPNKTDTETVSGSGSDTSGGVKPLVNSGPLGTSQVHPVPMTKKAITNRNIVILTIAGLVLALILLVVGILSYQALTKEVEVDDASFGELEDILDCDASGDERAVASCIAESFSGCKISQWSAPYTIAGSETMTMGYIVGGAGDGTCEIEARVKESNANPSLEGQSMTCSLDNTLAVDTAYSTIGASTCSGGLADRLFPETETTVDPDQDVTTSEETVDETAVDETTPVDDTTDTGN